jgi:hypothetical protein
MYLKTPFKGFRKLLYAALAGVLLLSACTPSAPNITIFETGEPAQIPGTAIPTELGPTSSPIEPTALPTEKPPANTETEVTFEVLSLVVPSDVASGASGSEMPRFENEDAAWWQKTPGHWEISLGDYYALQGKYHQPKIYVYPAQAYAEMVPPAFESIHRLNNILYGPTVPIQIDQLPTVPFFNAQQVFAAHNQLISFQNGSGVRFVTEYSQYFAPVNNHEMFYHFQGVTRDGAYYIIAIFPVTTPVLVETSDPAATLPPGGIAYPNINDYNTDWDGYYVAVTELLNATPEDSFSPQFGQLDALIQSMVVTAP